VLALELHRLYLLPAERHYLYEHSPRTAPTAFGLLPRRRARQPRQQHRHARCLFELVCVVASDSRVRQRRAEEKGARVRYTARMKPRRDISGGVFSGVANRYTCAHDWDGLFSLSAITGKYKPLAASTRR
jgi:hypothetical protein